MFSSSAFSGASKPASSIWWIPELLEDIAIGSTAPAVASESLA